MQCSLFLSSFTRCARKKGEDQPTRGCINAVAETTNPCEKFDGLKSFSHPILLSCSVQRNSIVENRTRWKKREEKEGRKGRISTVFSERSPRNLSPRRVFVYPCALTMAELRNNWVVEHELSGVEREQGINRLERGKEKVMGGGRGSESRGRVKSTQVEINRKVDVEQFARYFYCRYVLGGPLV